MIRIVALNSKYVHTLLAPYYLKENCAIVDIDILQCNINEKIDDLYQKCVSGNVKIFAFSCYIFNINIVQQLAELIRKNIEGAVIVYGGPEVSFDPAAYTLADYVITGEGELAFNQLMQAITNGDRPKEKIIKGEFCDLNKINPPYSKEYFEHCDGKIAYFEASRGCVFDCAYCMSGKSKLRKFALTYVFEQLDKFIGRNVRVVKFVDRTFNADKSHAHAIMRHILDNAAFHNLTYHFEIAADILSDEFFDIVALAPKGLFMFEIGVQTFNEKTLAAVARKSDLDIVSKNIKRLVDLQNSNIHTDLIAGLPFEDKQSFIKSFNSLHALGGDMLQLGFLKALKGSRIRTMMNDDGGYVYSNIPPYEIISTPCINSEELDELRDVEDACDKYHNSGYYTHTLSRFIKDNPYAFYERLIKHCKGASSLEDRYSAIKDCLLSLGHNINEVVGYLKYDYLSVNNSRILPKSLREIYTQEEKRLIKQATLNNHNFATTIGININNGNIEKCIFAINYDISPYVINCYPTKSCSK